MDDDGYLWYQGRSDDMFKAAGYRIGPGEIENCLVGHPAVANAAVVPKPDADRGALVKAYVVLAPGRAGDEALVRELQDHVRGQLAPYEYPKEIEFVARAADDRHRQGAAPRAAPARGGAGARRGAGGAVGRGMSGTTDGRPDDGRPGRSARTPGRWNRQARAGTVRMN